MGRARVLSLAVLLAAAASAQAPAELEFLPPCQGIEVTAEEAAVRLAGTVVATLKRGRRLGALESRDDAHKVQVFSGRTLRHGWIEAGHVRVLGDGDVDLAAEALGVAKKLNLEADVPALLAQVAALREKVTEAAQGARGPQARFRAIRRVLFREEGFRYHKGAHRLDRVLSEKMGNCISLSLLYLAVARDLGMPLRAVSVPKHAFVRYDDGRRRFNIEASITGVRISDAYVRRRYVQKGRPAPKLLSDLELVGMMMGQAGNDLALRGEHERAHELFARAVELAPRSSETYHNWGSCLLALRRNPQAADKFARAVRCDPGNVGARNAWAVALSKMGQTRSACQQLARIVEADPRHADAWFNWGTTLLRMGKARQAREKFARAVALKPELEPLAEEMLDQAPSGEFDTRTWEPVRPR
ncbi:MAG: transglutaminase family protein [Planctomycetota bacterium]